MLVTIIFSFSHYVFKRLLILNRKNQGLFGIVLIDNKERKRHDQKKFRTDNPLKPR